MLDATTLQNAFALAGLLKSAPPAMPLPPLVDGVRGRRLFAEFDSRGSVARVVAPRVRVNDASASKAGTISLPAPGSPRPAG